MDPIGITFTPNADAQGQPPQMGQTGPGGSDLADAFKILSLRMPQTVGPRSLASSRLMSARPGGAGGFNPHAAVFEALLRSLLGGGPAPTRASYQGGMSGSRVGYPIDAPAANQFPDLIDTAPHIGAGIDPGAPPPLGGSGDAGRPPSTDRPDPFEYQRASRGGY